jgi:hypothetical protein
LSQSAIVLRLEKAAEGELPLSTNTSVLAAYYVTVVEGLSVQAQDGADRKRLLQIGEFAMNAWPGGCRKGE